ncbi:DUF84 family protein [Marinithermus hydrothermalis]|uniref:inosine/xanthosine triphosphatase n=1 Tax=Marinithermus hydrothermalis (strain DSM 14884 / JCM 11576 / T1) TaxID=869210 RepID=F2NQ78_MARHT|nr:inosine/xanthosine triphosphatase [Marinithermus hydrothermalis]AEB11389.1 protein of unknown function DUF84 [Marinithermus hydrothermalis DSM 14884]
MRIALGSTNPTKRQALEQTLERLGLEAEIIAFAAPSGVRAQPMSEAETRAGAYNRARAAWEKSAASLAVGLEGGVDLASGWLTMYAAATDGQRVALGRGPGLALPEEALEALRQGQTLGAFLERRYGPAARRMGAIGWYTQGRLARAEALAQAALIALSGLGL